MKTSKDVGLYIKSLRESRGLTQEQLGEIVGVQKAAVQKWESGTTQNLKRTVIKELSEYFEVSAASFVVNTDSENQNNDNTLVDSVYVDGDIKITITHTKDNALSAEHNAAIATLVKTYLSHIKDGE